MKKNVFILFCSVLTLSFITPQILSSKTETQIQGLHKKISEDLLSIRREYPKSQPVVYPILDQVCKLYQISKSNLERKKKFKKIAKSNELEIIGLQTTSSSLKDEVDNLKNELDLNKKDFSAASKKIEQKDAVLTFLAKEKIKLAQERDKLAIDKEQLFEQLQKVQNQNIQNQEIQQNNNSQQEEKITQNIQNEKTNQNNKEKENFLNTAFLNMKHRKNNPLEHQNLSLTSTSDPISPL